MAAAYALIHGNVRITASENADTYVWQVFSGKKLVRDGVTASEDLRSLLRDIARKVIMPSKLAQGRLRSIATWPMSRHQHVPAHDLRTGDLLHVGGTNYILVQTAEVDGDTVRILAHGGVNPFTRAAGDLCNLSMRDASV